MFASFGEFNVVESEETLEHSFRSRRGEFSHHSILNTWKIQFFVFVRFSADSHEGGAALLRGGWQAQSLAMQFCEKNYMINFGYALLYDKMIGERWGLFRKLV